MSVRVVQWQGTQSKKDREESGAEYTLKSRWRIDIRFKKTDGTRVRDRMIIEAPSLSSAKKWGAAREAQLRDGSLTPGKPKPAPTWDEFFPLFLADRKGGASRGKPIKASYARSLVQVNERALSPEFGTTALDNIDDERVSKFRGELAKTLKPKSVNNIIGILGAAIKLAHAWKRIPVMPCRIKIASTKPGHPGHYSFSDYARLVEGAAAVGTRSLVLVLLGGDAGLRRGEMIGLRWTDCDFTMRNINVEQAAWAESAAVGEAEGLDELLTIDTPKSGKPREIPMSNALYAALKAHRHLRGEYVLCLEDGSPVPGHILRDWLEAAQRRAGLLVLGRLHKLRHTYGSHLAMKGTPARAIQETMGHSTLAMTERYMSLSPNAKDAVRAALNAPPPDFAKEAAQ